MTLLPALVAAVISLQQQPAASCCRVTLRVRVPDGTDTLYVTGSLAELGPWRPAGRALQGAGRGRAITLTVPAGTTLEYKFTLGSWEREALTATGSVPPNSRLSVQRDTVVEHDIPMFGNREMAEAQRRAAAEALQRNIEDWPGSGVLGRLVYWKDVPSQFLQPTRHVEIWLPPGYDSARGTRYPVLYMHDGQNLFDPRIANTGVDWGVDEAVMRLVERGTIRPVIVVGVWSTARRGPEYSPWHEAPQYARFLIEELMPRVNREFRTMTGPGNTAVMGSSMGGLLSFYLVTHHPQHFGACGCVSTHFPLSESVWQRVIAGTPPLATTDTTPYIVRDIANGLRAPRGARYWFDYGGQGLDAEYGSTHHAVRASLLRQGRREGRDFVIRSYPSASHTEASWRERLEDPLTFLYGNSAASSRGARD